MNTPTGKPTTPKVLARIELGKRRLVNILRRHSIANARTIEQKIADAGPSNQRVEPIHLTKARQELQRSGIILQRTIKNTPWYYLSESHPETVERRLQKQLPIYSQINDQQFSSRIGQALEIAVFRALRPQSAFNYLGAFSDLDEHDDSTLYKKQEPPLFFTGKRIPSGPLDFILLSGPLGTAGVEVKNVRPWLYPDHPEVKNLLLKACTIGVVPVLIARRISYVAFSELFRPCGVIVHQTFNQLYPQSAADIAMLVKDKRLLGYHDVRTTNEPDLRLIKFITQNLPSVLPEAVRKFEAQKDILLAYAKGEMTYLEFHVELRMRLGIYRRPEEYIEEEYVEEFDEYDGPEY